MRYIKTAKEISLRIRRLPMTREDQAYYNHAIMKPKQAHRAALAVARTYLRDRDQEHFIGMPLNSKNVPLGVHLVALGGPAQCQVEVPQVFRLAIHIGAPSLVVAHNHPSGDPLPSAADKALTRRIASAAHILGIGFLDHLILTPGPEYFSFRDHHDELFNRPDGLD
jgi:DNA repair protein RadC